MVGLGGLVRVESRRGPSCPPRVRWIPCARELVEEAQAQAERIANHADEQRDSPLETARTAAERLLAAIRAEAAEEVRALRAGAERELLAYVQRGHREADGLLDAARRERRGTTESSD